MKKIFPLLLFLVLLDSSCQKCLHCVYTYKDSAGVTHIIDLGTRCGKEQDIKTLEDSCSKIVTNVGGTCTCTQK